MRVLFGGVAIVLMVVALLGPEVELSGTVSLVELAWVAIGAIGSGVHLRGVRRSRDDLDVHLSIVDRLADAAHEWEAQVRATRGRLAREVIGLSIQGGMAMAGAIAMFFSPLGTPWWVGRVILFLLFAAMEGLLFMSLSQEAEVVEIERMAP